jgi:8-amino-7-oxononanoate synthase
LPPLVVAMTTEHVRRAQKEAWRRLAVQTHAQTLRTRLVEAGFSLPCAHTPWYSGIVPIVVGDNGQALRFAHELQQVHALCAVAIRPPTVPERTARVRLSLMATHTEEQMCRVAEALVASAQRLHMIP